MKFDRDETLAAALRLLDRDGLEKLTMRSLASELRVQAPSLYYYFPSKQDLLDAMANAIAGLALASVDEGIELEPAAFALEMGRNLRAALLSHRDGARVFSGSYSPTPNILALSDRLIAALLQQGREPAMAVHAGFNLVYYVVGFVIEEQAFMQKWGGADNTQDRIIAASKLRTEILNGYPALADCLEAIVEADFDTRFESGLRGLLVPPPPSDRLDS